MRGNTDCLTDVFHDNLFDRTDGTGLHITDTFAAGEMTGTDVVQPYRKILRIPFGNLFERYAFPFSCVDFPQTGVGTNGKREIFCNVFGSFVGSGEITGVDAVDFFVSQIECGLPGLFVSLCSQGIQQV